ncbi:MAG: RNA methyltransferase [Verrucomicrobia bacterium]|nr:RNA methyltransferase [Verrucomicrobiota bacterium]MCF7708312.1 RNA methyltransferase [Verrucomicrobiota bacterium]
MTTIHFKAVDSLDHPLFAPFLSMRRQSEHREQGIFIAEGEKVVRRLLESDFEIISMLMPEKWLNVLSPLIEQRGQRINAFTAEKPVLEELTGFSMYQGVLAVAKIPEPTTIDDVIRKSEKPTLIAAVEGISNAENMGGIVRNCAAFGASALITDETCASPFLRKAVRGSMGAVFRLPIIKAANLHSTLLEIREKDIPCIAAHPHSENTNLYNTDLSYDCCILLGSEGYGIRPETLEICNFGVALPMYYGVDSLNVSSACAVFLFEVRRQQLNRYGATHRQTSCR